MAQPVQEERGVARRRVDAVVDGELDQCERRAPLARVLDAMRAQHVLNNAVDTFSLTIRLRVVSCRHVQRASNKTEELAPEVARETWVTVTHESQWETVVTENVLEEQFGCLATSDACAHWRQAHGLAEAAHEHDNASVLMCVRR